MFHKLSITGWGSTFFDYSESVKLRFLSFSWERDAPVKNRVKPVIDKQCAIKFCAKLNKILSKLILILLTNFGKVEGVKER